MAASPSHQLGEAIGDFFERAIIQYLYPVVSKNGYYLDYKHPRPARGNKREVIGVDLNGNRHKLDIVVEKNGSEGHVGTPKAFIEVAWRRYVKHSKNKVQEIAGAILPLVETYRENMPFYAAVLAGEFTRNAIVQLRSQGFYVLHFTYEEICHLFETAGISVSWEEDTSDQDVQAIADAFYALSDTQMWELQGHFIHTYRDRLDELAAALVKALETAVAEIVVVPVHAIAQPLNTASEAVDFIMSYDESSPAPVLRYEILMRYNDGSECTMKYDSKSAAIQFLKQYI